MSLLKQLTQSNQLKCTKLLHESEQITGHTAFVIERDKKLFTALCNSLGVVVEERQLTSSDYLLEAESYFQSFLWNQGLQEARDPSLTYLFKKTGKAITKVILELTGHESGRMTRIARRYTQLDRLFKLLESRRDNLNAEVKKMIEEEYFDAEDAALTRVIETCSLTITLTKAETAAMKSPKKTVDYEAIVKELEQLVPELSDKLQELTDKYTEIVPPKDTPAKLLVKNKLEEGVSSSIKKFIQSFLSWAKNFDKKLNSIKKQLEDI